MIKYHAEISCILFQFVSPFPLLCIGKDKIGHDFEKNMKKFCYSTYKAFDRVFSKPLLQVFSHK